MVYKTVTGTVPSGIWSSYTRQGPVTELQAQCTRLVFNLSCTLLHGPFFTADVIELTHKCLEGPDASAACATVVLTC
jgi:hypothetical protein